MKISVIFSKTLTKDISTSEKTKRLIFIVYLLLLLCFENIIFGGSVIPAAVKTPGNKLVRIIMPGINMVAVKKPEKKFAKIDSDISKE